MIPRGCTRLDRLSFSNYPRSVLKVAWSTALQKKNDPQVEPFILFIFSLVHSAYIRIQQGKFAEQDKEMNTGHIFPQTPGIGTTPQSTHVRQS